MEEPKYFNEHVRCYSDGRVERKSLHPRYKNPKWRLVKLKPRPDGYFQIEIAERKYYVHRIIASCFLGLDIENLEDIVDHKDGKPSNNRVENLQVITQQENNFNNHVAKGYYWYKRYEKWMAQIQVNGKSIFLGLFDNEEQARQAYLDAKLIHHIIPERNHQ